MKLNKVLQLVNSTNLSLQCVVLLFVRVNEVERSAAAGELNQCIIAMQHDQATHTAAGKYLIAFGSFHVKSTRGVVYTTPSQILLTILLVVL